MHISPSVWLLCDDRMSHRSQLRGVAERLGYGWEEKTIGYNGLAALANAPFGARLWHLTPASRAALAPPWPDIVLSAGRRVAPVALAIKKRSPATLLIHLMWPDVRPDAFACIALPEHDAPAHKGNNIIRTLGAPHAVTPATLQKEAALWQEKLAHLPTPRITLLIGGDTRHMRYEPGDFKTLAAYAAAQAERLGGSLLVTSSPRTGNAAESWVEPLLSVPHLFHRFKRGEPNPYQAFLGLSDAIIASGDSVSMCSEACATGKPVYIFTPPHARPDTKGLLKRLFAMGAAKPYIYPMRLDWLPTPVPDAALTIARRVQQLLAQGGETLPVTAESS